ncbi:MAG: pilus assembly protein PilP [Desulfobacteraceae bacterium]|jgi:type IV pilus assembly protein PilP|nr:pilus assembly protein PilP [Desulfobacteraceae bacterium]
MGRNPVTIRYLISTICIVMLLWGCDSATEPPAKPKVVRKKIVAEEKQTAQFSQKKTVGQAKTKTADKTAKKISPAEVKQLPVAEVEIDKQPLVAKKVETQPAAAKKPAIEPKSDITKIDQPMLIQPPAAGQEPATKDKLIAAAPMAVGGLTGIPAEYNPAGKIDPFEPLFRESPVLSKKKKLKKRLPQTPLERIDLSQLKLVGIILASSGNRALVEESSGKGYVIKKGTYIGIHSGKVVNIKKETVIVEEEVEDAYGKIETRKREIKLPKPPGEF